MGYKLGKMVKIFYIFGILILTSFIEARPLPDISINPQHNVVNPPIEDIAKIYTISGTKDGISLKKKTIAKPQFSSLKNLRLLTPRDKYALKVLDKAKKESILLGLGDPFYIHAQHIDYEGSRYFGGNVDAQFEIAFPLDMDVSYIILMAQDGKNLRKINEIEIK